MSIRVKARCINEKFGDGDFKIFLWTVIQSRGKLKVNKNGMFSTKGNDPYIIEGKEYELELEEISFHKIYGGTYKILDVPSIKLENIENLTIEESMVILEEITTPNQANNLLSAYPNFVFKALYEGIESFDILKIHNVGEYRLRSYVRNLTTKYRYLGLIGKIKEYKCDISDCGKLFSEYKTESKILSVFADYPYYVLTEVLKRGFEQVDKMLMDIRPELKESDQRVEALIIHVLRKNELTGSTRLDASKLFQYINTQLNVPYLIPKLKDVSVNSDYIYYDERTNDLSVMDTYLAEVKIAEFVKNKLANSRKLDIDWKKYKKVDDFEMTNTQLDCLRKFCEYDISLLIGYSGSGKTTSLRGLISMLEDNNLTYTLLAPTGKASMRITESVNRESSTIHRKALKDKEIWTDVVICDESSMIGLETFVMMLNTIQNKRCKIVLCGDNFQLMPVEKACVFNDIINSNVVPMTMLTEIFRYNSSGALYVATNVRQGKPFFDNDSDLIKWKDNEVRVGDNYKFIQTEDIFNDLIREYMKLINKGIKPNEILCLSPQNIGEEGTYAINNALQSEINPSKPNESILVRKIGSTEITFRLGDKILNKKNDYKALPYESWKTIQDDRNGMLTSEDVDLTSIFNGQDGIIRDIDDKKIVAQIDEEVIVFDKSKINNLLLGLCISVHSSQGAEQKYVINVVSPKHSRMLNRNLLYVADTRAKVKHIDIGDMDTYNKALLIDGNKERDTWLPSLLKETT